MIYLDTSVALAHLLGQGNPPPDWLWDGDLVASRLLEYELWNRLHAYGYAERAGDDVIVILNKVLLLALEPTVLCRALQPLPKQPRTLDALHLATACFVQAAYPDLRLASYDRRMIEAASELGIAPVALE